MARMLLVIFTVLAVLWMAFPDQSRSKGTKEGFAPGTPDPNLYQKTLDFGWPLAWITWQRSWKQSAGYEKTELGRFQPFNFVIHILAILTPLLVVCWLSRSVNHTKSAKLPDASLDS